MAQYLRLFDTVNEFNSAYTGEEYIEPWVSYTEENEHVDYNKSEMEKLLGTPLTFEVTGDGNIVWAISGSTSFAKTISYSKNGGEWTEITSTTAGVSIPVVSGDTVQFKGDNSYYASAWTSAGGGIEQRKSSFFKTTCTFNAYGNIMSLIDSEDFATLDTFEANGCFAGLFNGGWGNGATGLTSVANLVLPVKELTFGCYASMFHGCSSLVDVPQILATTMAESCYDGMFMYCTSLTSVPKDYLSAKTVFRRSYACMFWRCRNLSSIPDLPATALGASCYFRLFEETDITDASISPNYLSSANVLAEGCYVSMFGETNITRAPDLLASTLVERCYESMFGGCTNLNYIKCLATDVSASNCLSNWVTGVAASGTFVKKSGVAWPSGTGGIPTGWTVEDAS